MRQSTKKLMSAILSIIFVLITLGTSTLAWITLTNTVTISSFTTEVTTGEGIEISVDGGLNFYNDVPFEDILAIIQRQYGQNFQFEIVTSPNGIDFVNFFNPHKPPIGYVELEFIIRSRTATTVYLEEGTTFTSPFIVEWTSDAEFSTGEGHQILPEDLVIYRSALAARLSVTDVSTANVVVYELPYRPDVLAVNSEGREVVVEAGNTVLGNEAREAGAVEYYNSKRKYQLDPAEAELPPSITDLSAKTHPVLVLGDPEPNGDGFVYGNIVTRIWIEGWDAECFNSILNNPLFVDIFFTGIPTK